MPSQHATDVRAILAAFQERPVAFYPAFARIAGSVTAGLFLSQLFYWSPRSTLLEGGWVKKGQAEWEGETTLSRSELETARAKCKALGLVEYDLKGLPATMCYRLDMDTLTRMLAAQAEADKAAKKAAETSVESEAPVCGNPANLIATSQGKQVCGNPAILLTETTTETTTESVNAAAFAPELPPITDALSGIVAFATRNKTDGPLRGATAIPVIRQERRISDETHRQAMLDFAAVWPSAEYSLPQWRGKRNASIEEFARAYGGDVSLLREAYQIIADKPQFAYPQAPASVVWAVKEARYRRANAGDAKERDYATAAAELRAAYGCEPESHFGGIEVNGRTVVTVGRIMGLRFDTAANLYSRDSNGRWAVVEKATAQTIAGNWRQTHG